MPTKVPPTKKTSQPNDRRADTLIHESEKKMGSLALIMKCQVHLWKALLFSLFFAVFVSAMTLAISFNLSDMSYAAFDRIREQIEQNSQDNVALQSDISSRVFLANNKWEALTDGNHTDSIKVRNSQGAGSPFVDFSFANAHDISRVILSTDRVSASDSACALKDFSVGVSENGTDFQQVFSGSMNSVDETQAFRMPAGSIGKHVRIYLDSNYGDKHWTCLTEVGILK